MLVHDAARPCLPRRDLDRLLADLADHPVGGLLATPAADTLKRADGSWRRAADRRPRRPVARPDARRCSATGASAKRSIAAHAAGRIPTDEAQALEWLGDVPRLVAGAAANLKITSAADLAVAAALLKETQCMRIGSGIDVHAFGPGDFVMLGGVRVAHTHGVLAHSDGDVRAACAHATRCSGRRAWATSASISRTPIRAGRAPTASTSCER